MNNKRRVGSKALGGMVYYILPEVQSFRWRPLLNIISCELNPAVQITHKEKRKKKN